MNSTREVINSSDIAEILEKERVREVTGEIRALSLDELKERFGAASSGRIIVSHVIKSIIWHAVGRIRSGDAPGVDGNLRSFYYQWIKPVMAKIPGALEAARDPYDTMLGAFVTFVAEHKLFSYGELDLTDQGWEYRRLGTGRPEVVVFAEKLGFWRWLKRAQKIWPVTVVALGGTPSLLSSEYLLRELSERVNLDATTIELVSIVDWDPAGWQIERAFARQLRSLGAAQVSLSPLITPSLYSEEEQRIFRFGLPKKQKTKNRKWLEATGGLDGEAFGLESDATPRAALVEALHQQLEALGVDVEPSSTQPQPETGQVHGASPEIVESDVMRLGSAWRGELHQAYREALEVSAGSGSMLLEGMVFEKLESSRQEFEEQVQQGIRERWVIHSRAGFGESQGRIKVLGVPGSDELERRQAGFRLYDWARGEPSVAGAAQRLGMDAERFGELARGETRPTEEERETIERVALLPVDSWPVSGVEGWTRAQAQEELRTLVLASSESRKQLAERIGIGASPLSRWIREDRPVLPQRSRREDIERVFSIPAQAWDQ